MASTSRRQTAVKPDEGMEACEVVQDHLETLAWRGAQEMLSSARNEEVEAYLARGRYERTDAYRGYVRTPPSDSRKPRAVCISYTRSLTGCRTVGVD